MSIRTTGARPRATSGASAIGIAPEGAPGAATGIFLIAMILLPALWVSAARADGGFFRPDGKSLWEYEQVALLDWDEGASTETLTILPGILGDARRFAWIVPVPALPTWARAPRELVRWLGFVLQTDRHIDPYTTPSLARSSVQAPGRRAAFDSVGCRCYNRISSNASHPTIP